ncbi:MAG TPA: Glu/Leu/Phe/Val dehydrogenase dimerization domain-containing protein, partial [Anaerolineales bacterium]|nr:Glu/Leu/Phe/Val dehydrogenase dimerization domain-containing protein [Anaerolineales bacterium]
MIPERMNAFLRELLPEQTFENRLIRDGDKRFLEFGILDVERLSRLGIQVDNLGPRLVVAMWDEGAQQEIGGYLVVDNLAMGQPSMGGIRMLPEVTPAVIHNLARGMTLKNAAADLPYGGGKSGIVAEYGLSADDRLQVVRGFAHLLYRYRDVYLPGPDVGTNDADMKTIAVESGLDNAVSKPVDLGGNRIDQLGAAAGGVIIALDELLKEMPRLSSLAQFENLVVPEPEELTVLIQGCGAVGAHAARFLCSWLPGAQVTGISDENGYLFDQAGLPVDTLFRMWQDCGSVTRQYFLNLLINDETSKPEVKFSSEPDDLLRESAFCFIPAAPIANYLDTDPSSNPSMLVDQIGRWHVIIEGANTYSPDPERKAFRSRMERAVFRQMGVMIAPDYLVNSGGVIFAAQEQLIKTPEHLRFPDEIKGDQKAVESWLEEYAAELSELAEKRRVAAESHRDEVLRRNIRELIDLLISDADMLPNEAAERISIRRIAARESDRKAFEIMEVMPSIPVDSTVKQAAAALIQASSPILVVVNDQSELAGVVTDWDITRATA